jgi:hypothetical protein
MRKKDLIKGKLNTLNKTKGTNKRIKNEIMIYVSLVLSFELFRPLIGKCLISIEKA